MLPFMCFSTLIGDAYFSTHHVKVSLKRNFCILFSFQTERPYNRGELHFCQITFVKLSN